MVKNLNIKVIKEQNVTNRSCPERWVEFDNIVQTKNNLIKTKDMVKNLNIKVIKEQNVTNKSCQKRFEELENIIQTKHNLI